MRHPISATALLCAFAMLTCGCASLKRSRKPKPPRAQPVHAEKTMHLGQIILVNEDARFVLVDAGDLGLPAERLELRVLRQGTEIARLRVTQARKRPMFVADILRGEPAKGDDVFQ